MRKRGICEQNGMPKQNDIPKHKVKQLEAERLHLALVKAIDEND